MDGISHMQIVDGIAAVATRVMMVALPVSVTFEMSMEQCHEHMKQDVIAVLQRQDYDPVYIVERAEWSPTLSHPDVDERTKLIFVSLVLGIYS